MPNNKNHLHKKSRHLIETPLTKQKYRIQTTYGFMILGFTATFAIFSITSVLQNTKTQVTIFQTPIQTTINSDIRYQTIDGFGASIIGETGYRLLSQEDKEKLADLLWRDSGANTVRLEVLPKIEVNQTYESVNDNSDPFTFNWYEEKDQDGGFVRNPVDPAVRGHLQAALDRGSITNILSTSWSQAGWNKEGCHLPYEEGQQQDSLQETPCDPESGRYGGTIANVDEYVEYITAFLLRFEENYGRSVTHLPPANEPGWVPDYAGTEIPPTQYAEIIKALAKRVRELKDQGQLQTIPTLLAADTANLEKKSRTGAFTFAEGDPIFGKGYENGVLNDPDSAKELGFFSTHDYSSRYTDTAPWADLSNLLQKYGKEGWQTETSWISRGVEEEVTDMDVGLRTFGWIHHALALGNFRLWNYWLASYVSGVGKHCDASSSATDCGQGLLSIKREDTNDDTVPDTYSLVVPKRYWAFRHFSQFVKPGSVRIAATTTDPNLLVSGYDTGDNLVIEAANPTTAVITTTVKLPFVPKEPIAHVVTSPTEDWFEDLPRTIKKNFPTLSLDPQTIHTWVLPKPAVTLLTNEGAFAAEGDGKLTLSGTFDQLELAGDGNMLIDDSSKTTKISSQNGLTPEILTSSQTKYTGNGKIILSGKDSKIMLEGKRILASGTGNFTAAQKGNGNTFVCGNRCLAVEWTTSEEKIRISKPFSLGSTEPLPDPEKLTVIHELEKRARIIAPDRIPSLMELAGKFGISIFPEEKKKLWFLSLRDRAAFVDLEEILSLLDSAKKEGVALTDGEKHLLIRLSFENTIGGKFIAEISPTLDRIVKLGVPMTNEERQTIIVDTLMSKALLPIQIDTVIEEAKSAGISLNEKEILNVKTASQRQR